MKKVIPEQISCRICGEFKKLSKEHWPPKSCYNSHGILLKTFDHLYNSKSYVYGKSIKKLGGLTHRTLCEDCNQETGRLYVDAFKDFIILGMYHNENRIDLRNIYSDTYPKIKPLNILKEIIVGFMSAEKTQLLVQDASLKEFVLKKENQLLPENYRAFLYYNSSANKRFNGWSLINSSGIIHSGLEISFKPFGYFLTINGDNAPNESMFEITNFKNYQYNESVDITFNLPLLFIENIFSGIYA